MSAVLALRSRPSILVMDEPTAGLDPLSSKRVLARAAGVRAAGGTVLITSHLMEEVERLADRLLILKDGKARAYGTVDTVKKEFKSKSIEDIFVQIYKEKSTEVAHG